MMISRRWDRTAGSVDMEERSVRAEIKENG
jgi:hypothetical protein